MTDGVLFIQDLVVVMLIAGFACWVSQRLGLSSVVGYLLAGMIIGPYTPPFQLVTDVDRIRLLSDVGLVFLMFFIGTGLSLQRLRHMGLPVLVATAVTALLVMAGSRTLAGILGWSPTEGLFLAGMLMVSSSAIISKVLEEIDAMHRRSGQLALGITVLEDIVAVVMLTLLSSLIAMGGDEGGAADLGGKVGFLGAFVILLTLGGLMLLPKFLSLVDRSASSEVLNLIMIGLMLGLAWLTVRAGFSLALGAFLLGAIIAETPQKGQVARSFEGLRDMFSAVFFVSIGMLIEVNLLVQSIWLILGITLFTLVLRSVAATIGLVVGGFEIRNAARAGLNVVPIGEFSFILAQLGVVAGVLPETFYPLAVGVSLGTALAAPPLARHSQSMGAWLESKVPRFLGEAVRIYHSLWENLEKIRNRSLFLRLARKRMIQIVLEVLVVSAMLFFSDVLFFWLVERYGRDVGFANGLPILYWSGMGILLLPFLLAIWRNLSVLSMMASESMIGLSSNVGRQVLETTLKLVAGLLMIFWIWNLLPLAKAQWWSLVIIFAVLGLCLLVGWKRLVFWHSKMEIELNAAFASPLPTGKENKGDMWVNHHAEWDLNIGECILPDNADCGGQTIEQLAIRKTFGCSIVGIDRQGFLLGTPGPQTVLYPRDRVLILGTPDQIETLEAFLRKTDPGNVIDQTRFDELIMETVIVPAESPALGRPLRELDITGQTGVQMVGIRSVEISTLSPGADQMLLAGDELLVLGTRQEMDRFRGWLAGQ